MKIIDYMTAIKARTPTGTTYAAAKLLKVNEQTARNWTTGKSLPDAYGCVRIAQVLDLPPMQVIADIEAEREAGTEKGRRWQDLARKFASSALAVGCITIGTIGGSSPWQGAEASQTIVNQTLYKLYACWMGGSQAETPKRSNMWQRVTERFPASMEIVA